jgi:broad specificity phosphatase PhoE
LSRTVLIFVRHGATLANVHRPYLLQGLRPNLDLTDAGRRQARAAAAALRDYPISRVYCSPLKRAVQTAEPIAGALGLPVQRHKGFLEADLGLWSGLTWPEVERHWPEESRAFREDAERCGYLGGENLAEVRNRVLPAVEELAEGHDGEMVAVVGHGVVNRVLLAHWLGLPLRCARRLPQENGGFSIVDWDGGGASVRTLNAVRHLEATRADCLAA